MEERGTLALTHDLKMYEMPTNQGREALKRSYE